MATVKDTYIPPTPKPTTLYLDFGADANAVYNTTSGPLVYYKPDSGFTSDASTITTNVQSIYGKYNILFTDTKPTSGAYDTLYIGGTPGEDFPPAISLGIPTNVLGQSAINIGNKIKNESGVVFSGDYAFSPAKSTACYLTTVPLCSPSADIRLSAVIAHEAGHLVGLVHVTDPTQIMWPEPVEAAGYGTPFKIGGKAIVGDNNINPNQNPNLFEDSDAILGCNLGLSVNGVKDCSTIPSQGIYYDNGNTMIPDTVTFTFSETPTLPDPPLYDARLLLYLPTNLADNDSGPVEFYLGTLTSGVNETLNIPYINGDTFGLEAAVYEGGPLQMFQGTYSADQTYLRQQIFLLTLS